MDSADEGEGTEGTVKEGGGIEKEKGTEVGGGVGGRLAFGEEGLSAGGGVRAPDGEGDNLSREGESLGEGLAEAGVPKLRERD